jgi:phosphoribosylglycinamide formyltransferase-1
MEQLRLAIFASGSGSNMQAIADAIDTGKLNATIGAVVSNKAEAGVLDRARRLGIPTLVMDPKSYPNESSYTKDLVDGLEKRDVNFVALAGYLRKVPSEVVARFKGRMLNIHPALLPSFGGKGYYGRRVHAAVLEMGLQWTGVTVHLVDEEYDTGPIVLQKPVPVERDDTPESLAARVLITEHELYPAALKLFAEDLITVDGRKVKLDADQSRNQD